MLGQTILYIVLSFKKRSSGRMYLRKREGRPAGAWGQAGVAQKPRTSSRSSRKRATNCRIVRDGDGRSGVGVVCRDKSFISAYSPGTIVGVFTIVGVLQKGGEYEKNKRERKGLRRIRVKKLGGVGD